MRSRSACSSRWIAFVKHSWRLRLVAHLLRRVRRAGAALLALAFALALASLGGLEPPPPPASAAADPVLRVEAPSRVEVGEPIALELVVRGAKSLAGYEAQVLFDPTAAHLYGLRQRDNALKRLGRDAVPLQVAERADGLAVGAASCP
jgi:hypothetical protein